MVMSGRTATTSGALVRPADQPGDLGWVIKAHGELYAAEFGWDSSFEALVARIVADFARAHDPRREAGWIAELAASARGASSAWRPTSPASPSCASCSWTRRCAGGAWAASSWRPAASTRAPASRWSDAEKHDSWGKDLVGETWVLDL